MGIALSNYRKDNLDQIAAVVRSGGIISISSGQARAASGIHKSVNGKNSPSSLTLQALSVNLPRLAYESNKDETYFRAKLALMIKPSLAAMYLRKKAVLDNVRRGLLPTFSAATQSSQLASSNIVINLTGTRESVYSILGYDEANGGQDIMQKVLKTTVEVAASQGKQAGEDTVGVAMVFDDSGTRFASLDSEKYGKISLMQSQNTTSYSQGMTINGKDLVGGGKSSALLKECAAIDRLMNGGFAASLDLTDLSLAEVRGTIEAASELPFFRPRIRLAACSTCGQRVKVSAEKCDACKSPHRLQIYS
jgi:ribonucleoside-triphosphate reductase